MLKQRLMQMNRLQIRIFSFYVTTARGASDFFYDELPK